MGIGEITGNIVVLFCMFAPVCCLCMAGIFGMAAVVFMINRSKSDTSDYSNQSTEANSESIEDDDINWEPEDTNRWDDEDRKRGFLAELFDMPFAIFRIAFGGNDEDEDDDR